MEIEISLCRIKFIIFEKFIQNIIYTYLGKKDGPLYFILMKNKFYPWTGAHMPYVLAVRK